MSNISIKASQTDTFAILSRVAFFSDSCASFWDECQLPDNCPYGRTITWATVKTSKAVAFSMLLAPTGFLCVKVRIRFFNALMPPKLTYWAILLCFDWAVTLRRWKAHFHFCLDGEAATKKGHCGHCGLIEGSTSLVNCDQTNWLIVLRCKASLSKPRLALMRQFFLSFSFQRATIDVTQTIK